MDLIVISFLILTLLVTLLREIKWLDFLWKPFPLYMQFVPTWSFFAPIPNMHDYHFLYRYILNDGTILEWKYLDKLVDKRHCLSLFWNPNKRFLKGSLDIAHDLLRFSNIVKDKDQICTSLPYLQVLNHVDALNTNQNVKSLQFAVLTSSRIYDYELSFLSEVHPITKR